MKIRLQIYGCVGEGVCLNDSVGINKSLFFQCLSCCPVNFREFGRGLIMFSQSLWHEVPTKVHKASPHGNDLDDFYCCGDRYEDEPECQARHGMLLIVKQFSVSLSGLLRRSPPRRIGPCPVMNVHCIKYLSECQPCF